MERIAQYDDERGLTMQDAVAEANKRGLRILSNKEIDERLASDIWKGEKEMYPCWTGTLIAYEEPGTAFGKTIEFRGLTLKVPQKFQGKKDAAIVCNHPNFTLKDNEITLGKEAKLISLPFDDDWYLTEKEFGVPCENKRGSGTSQARYLVKYQDSSYVGLLVRWGRRWGDYSRRGVVAGYRPSDRFGVFGEKINVGKHKHQWEQVCTLCGAKRGK